MIYPESMSSYILWTKLTIRGMVLHIEPPCSHRRHRRHRRGLTFGTIWVLVMLVLPEGADEYTKYTRKVVFRYRIGPPFDSVQLPEKSG